MRRFDCDNEMLIPMSYWLFDAFVRLFILFTNWLDRFLSRCNSLNTEMCTCFGHDSAMVWRCCGAALVILCGMHHLARFRRCCDDV